MEPEEAFGRVLKELRKDRKLSQEALAFEAGLQRNYISLLELGRNSASIRTVFKLAGVLGVSVSELLARVESLIDGGGKRRSAKRSAKLPTSKEERSGP